MLFRSLFGDEVDELATFDPITGRTLRRHDKVAVYPKSHFVAPRERTKRAVETIKAELEERRTDLEHTGKLLEAQRIHQRTMFDLEMIKEIGYCHGIENYARHLTGRAPGQPPPTLLDYLPADALMVVDESHQTVPQIRGMYFGDRSRKEVLVSYGFRLPSALDNRPLNFAEWEERVGQVIYVSATPGPYELAQSKGVVVEQIIRPTGLIDPPIDVRPVKGQVDNLLVPVCVSSSHIAFGSIRMEPVFMILGQSAATAAVLAMDAGIAVQDVPYARLRERLLRDGQILEYRAVTEAGKIGRAHV